MRRPRRELPTWFAQEVPARLRDYFENQSIARIRICYWLRTDWTIQ